MSVADINNRCFFDMPYVFKELKGFLPGKQAVVIF